MAARKKSTSKKATKKTAKKAPARIDRKGKILSALRAKFGAAAATTVSEARKSIGEISGFIKTGVDVIDNHIAALGGLPEGRWSEWFGPEGCIDGEARVAFALWRNGKLINKKGGTLRRLYERFNCLDKHHLSGSFDTVTVPSVDDDGRVFHNRVLAVIDSGVKPAFKLVVGLDSVIATADHKFMTPTGYKRLDELSVGDEVMLHANIRHKEEHRDRTNRRPQVYVKNHPYAGTKLVGRYVYQRYARSRAVIEAKMNGMTLDAWKARLNSGEMLHELKFLRNDQHVHHIDEDFTNDEIDNLEVTSPSEHARHHALGNDAKLRFVAVPGVVALIEPAGDRHVYDVKVEGPNHNFVANRFVVHNCGKTAMLYTALGANQRDGGVSVLIDAEHSFDSTRAEVFGVDVEDLIIIEPEYLDTCCDEIMTVLQAHDGQVPLLIGWDSLASLVSEKGFKMSAKKRGVADTAGMLSHEFKKINVLLPKKRAHIMLINQIRVNVGVMFGNNVTTPGGNAPKFYASLRCQFFGGKALKDKKGKHLGKVVTVLAIKTRMSEPFRKVRVRFDYATGYNNIWSTIEHAKTEELIDPREGGYKGKGREGINAYIDAMTELGWQPSSPIVAVDGDTGEGEAIDDVSDDEDDDSE